MSDLLYEPLVSVVVASYNYGRYLRDNLDSILNQTYKNFEVIVIDDGSTDDSVEIIKEYCDKDTRFHFFEHENHANLGLTKSLKIAIDYCKGEYIAFCESDDYWHEEYLKEKINYLNEHRDADVIVNKFKVFGASEEQVKHYTENPQLLSLYDKLEKLKKPEMIYFKILEDWTFPTFSIVMVRASSLRACNLDAPAVNRLDVWLFWQLTIHYKTGFVDKELTYFRRSGESLTGIAPRIMTFQEYKKSFFKTIKFSAWQRFRLNLVRVKRECIRAKAKLLKKHS